MRGVSVMNILFVTGIFANNKKDTSLGGMSYAVYKSALGMQKRGHTIRILEVSNRNRTWYYRNLKIISVRSCLGVEQESVWDIMFDTIKRERCIQKAIRKLNQEEAIDIVQYAGWFGLGLLHSNQIPAVMRMSSYTKVQLVHNYSKEKRHLLQIVEYLAAKRMNYVFAPSRIMAAGVGKDIKKNVGVIETPFFQEEVEWDDHLLRTKLKDKKYVLYFGRMSVDKGILIIKDILYKTLQKYPSCYFVFAGGSWTHNGMSIEKELLLEAQEYKDKVLFTGMLPKEQLFPVIKSAEAILIPSLADNLPNSCAEAMALGKVVIGTDGSSLEQFIKDGKNGFLAEPGSAESLYSCLEYVLEMDESEKQKIGGKAKKTIEKFDLENYSKRMEVLYEKIIKK